MTVALQQDSKVRLRYVRGLDGLRAIAVAVVVVFHATETWLRGGFLGVDVFFVLSGFLITSQLLAEWQQAKRIDVRAFWRRRARRILAALYLLLAATVMFALVFRPEEVAIFRGDALAALAYVGNWYFIFHNQPYFEAVAHPSPLIHLWSLGVEEQFYLIWPLLLAPCLLLFRRWTALLILALAAGSSIEMALLYRPEVDPSRLYYGTDTHASGLLLGALLAFYWRPVEQAAVEGSSVHLGGRVLRYLRGSLALDLLGVGLMIGLAGFFVLANDSQPLLYRGGFTLVAALTALSVVAVSHPSARLVRSLLELPPLRWLGRRSYSIYLWHWPVIVFTRPGAGVALSGYALLALRIGLSLLLAELSFSLVEEPIRRGGLVQVWRWLQEARRARRWERVLAMTSSGVLVAGLLLGICIAAAQAKAPAPPSYLAEASVNTIVVPNHPVAGASSLTPTAAPSLPGSPTGMLSATATATVPAVAASVPEGSEMTASLSSATSAGVAASGDAIPAPPATPISAGTVIGIGDSVMLGAVSSLNSAINGIEIDAAVSRQVSAGIGILQQLRTEGALGDAVVIALGSNGTFTSGQFDQIMSVLTGVPRVVFINIKVPRSWQDSNNAVIANGVRRYQHTRLVDWYDVSANHPEFFQDDEYHLRPGGADAYAAMVAQAIVGP